MVIDRHVEALRNARICGVGQYAARLRNNSTKLEKVADLLCEGQVALMFRGTGWQVRLRECPALELNIDGNLLYQR
jgi:hypothetical protein